MISNEGLLIVKMPLDSSWQTAVYEIPKLNANHQHPVSNNNVTFKNIP